MWVQQFISKILARKKIIIESFLTLLIILADFYLSINSKQICLDDSISSPQLCHFPKQNFIILCYTLLTMTMGIHGKDRYNQQFRYLFRT